MTTKKILLIEDEDHLAQGLVLNLKLAGHDVTHAPNGKKGLELWQQNSFDLIILDLMMPEVDGLTVLKKIRERDYYLPVLILTAKDAIHDKLQGLSMAADDYMTKPFNLEELLLRCQRLLDKVEQSGSKKINDDEIIGDFTVHFSKSVVIGPKGARPLTHLEAKILRLFLLNEGEILSRGQLLEEAWGHDENITTRTVDNFIVRLRKYFEKDPKNPQYFVSVRSIGYKFQRIK